MESNEQQEQEKSSYQQYLLSLQDEETKGQAVHKTDPDKEWDFVEEPQPQDVLNDSYDAESGDHSGSQKEDQTPQGFDESLSSQETVMKLEQAVKNFQNKLLSLENETM